MQLIRKFFIILFLMNIYVSGITSTYTAYATTNPSKDSAKISLIEKIKKTPRSLTKNDMNSLRILLSSELTQASTAEDTASAQEWLATATYAVIQNPRYASIIQLNRMWPRLPLDKRSKTGNISEVSTLKQLIKNQKVNQQIAILEKYIEVSSVEKDDLSRKVFQAQICNHYYEMRLNKKFHKCADQLLQALPKAKLDIPNGTKRSVYTRIQITKMNYYILNNQINDGKKTLAEWGKSDYASESQAAIDAFKLTLNFLSSKPVSNSAIVDFIRNYPDHFATPTLERYNAQYFIINNRLDEAQKILEPLANAKQNDDERRRASATLDLAEVFYKKNNIDTSVKYIKTALAEESFAEYPNNIQGNLILSLIQKIEDPGSTLAGSKFFNQTHSLNIKYKMDDPQILIMTQIGLIISKSRLTDSDHTKLKSLGDDLRKNASEAGFIIDLLNELTKKTPDDNKKTA